MNQRETIKTCVSCAHYVKDSLGAEQCLRTRQTRQKTSLVDGKTREIVDYELCKFERYGGQFFRVLRRMFGGRWSCGRDGKFWVSRSPFKNE